MTTITGQRLLDQIPNVLHLREYDFYIEKAFTQCKMETFWVHSIWTNGAATILKQYLQEDKSFERAVRECIKYLVVREGLKGYECNTIYPPEGVDGNGEKFSLYGPALVKAPTPFAYIIREKLLPKPNWWSGCRINYYGNSKSRYIWAFCPNGYDPVEEILKKLLAVKPG